MSEMEYNKGKLIPVDKSYKEVYEECCGVGAIPPYKETYEEAVKDGFEEFGYVVLKDKIYQVKWSTRRGDLYEFSKVDKQLDGSLEFETYHYNGGAHWIEVVEDEL